jgi:hypothetical protein
VSCSAPGRLRAQSSDPEEAAVPLQETWRRARTHRVTLTLTPKRADGGDLLISAALAEASGAGFDPGDVSGWVGR